MSPGRKTNQCVAVVNEWYEAECALKDSPVINIRQYERTHGLKAGQLHYYRANRNRRKVSAVNLIHTAKGRDTAL